MWINQTLSIFIMCCIQFVYTITKLQEQQHPMKDVHSIKVSVSAIVFSIRFTQIHWIWKQTAFLWNFLKLHKTYWHEMKAYSFEIKTHSIEQNKCEFFKIILLLKNYCVSPSRLSFITQWVSFIMFDFNLLWKISDCN